MATAVGRVGVFVGDNAEGPVVDGRPAARSVDSPNLVCRRRTCINGGDPVFVPEETYDLDPILFREHVVVDEQEGRVSSRSSRLRKDAVDHVAVHVGQSALDTVVVVAQPLVFDAQQV